MSSRWNYLTVEVKTTWTGIKAADIQSELTKHGQLGWELVNVVFAAPMTAALLFFKREA